MPRWGINSPIRDHGVDPGAYTGHLGWTSRQHYLDSIVPAATAARPEVLTRHHVDVDTFIRWVAAKSLYAQEQRSGRTVIVRPSTLAGLLQCSISTIHRCQRAARDLGLELVLIPGRMLSELEVYKARKAGSPQRGLSTVSAFVVPAWLPHPVETPRPVDSVRDHDTPTRGTRSSIHLAVCFTFKPDDAGRKRAPLRSARLPRKRVASWQLAHDLAEQALFLRKCPPGRIAGQLSRYQTAPRPWKAIQILRAMDAVNVRLGYTAPVRPKTTPWGLLAWYLHQIDPIADHPSFDGAFPHQ